MSDQERPITEAEHRAWVGQRMPELAGELTTVLPQDVRDAGIRIEWASDGEHAAVRDAVGGVRDQAVQDAGSILAYDLAPPLSPWEARHRCLGRPERQALTLGESWTCPECDSVWTVTEEEDFCGECGQSRGMIRTWKFEQGGRWDTAPRYEPPPPFTPFRNIIPQATKCYRMASGAMVHVKPGCRCPR